MCKHLDFHGKSVSQSYILTFQSSNRSRALPEQSLELLNQQLNCFIKVTKKVPRQAAFFCDWGVFMWTTLSHMQTQHKGKSSRLYCTFSNLSSFCIVSFTKKYFSYISSFQLSSSVFPQMTSRWSQILKNTVLFHHWRVWSWNISNILMVRDSHTNQYTKCGRQDQRCAFKQTGS